MVDKEAELIHIRKMFDYFCGSSVSLSLRSVMIMGGLAFILFHSKWPV